MFTASCCSSIAGVVAHGQGVMHCIWQLWSAQQSIVRHFKQGSLGSGFCWQVVAADPFQCVDLQLVEVTVCSTA